MPELDFSHQFAGVLAGTLPPADIKDFLLELAARGETIAELTEAAKQVRQRGIPLVAPPADAIDVCGTGGDQAGTVNVSTAVAILLAACDVPVVKHGNRAATSQSGATDVLQALGVQTDLNPATARKQLFELGITFLAAPNYHPALVSLAPLRKSLGQRTIFNLLGPLVNPAGVRRQLVGVFAPQWMRPMAETLRNLGSTAAWVVHGAGLDELTVTGSSQVAELRDGEIIEWILDPTDYGMRLWTQAALRGGTPMENAEALRAMLAGAAGAYRDITLLNAAAGLMIAGRATDLTAGLAMAESALDSGKAAELLDHLIKDAP